MSKIDMVKYTRSVEIIPHPNPKKGKSIYRNAINNDPMKKARVILNASISILYRGEGEQGRIILGPKDFYQFFDYFFPLETCTQEELEKEFERTYPKDMLVDFDQAMMQASANSPKALITQPKLDKLRNQGLDAMRQAGFGLKPEERKSAYTAFGEQMESEKEGEKK
jgi:hypothetical protein